MLRIAAWSGLGVVALCFVGFGGWLLSLPPTTVIAAPPPISTEEAAATLAALRPPMRPRPLIAVIGINDATETTDYLLTYGILRRADVADVLALATGSGPVQLYPALTVEADMTIATFDQKHTRGADYVIVPAMSRDDDPVVLAWLRQQAAKGAIVIGVCAGAKVVAAAGLLDGRDATTHWYFVDALLKNHPSIRYLANRRIVVDRGVATTTGITASMPMMLTLIEAIAGREKAAAVAQDLGLRRWDTRHASSEFGLTQAFVINVLNNVLVVWNKEQLGVALRPGIDEVSLALAADAWSRTYRSHVVTFAASPVKSLSGIHIIPDRNTASWSGGPLVTTIEKRRPGEVLNDTLAAIGQRYGGPTAGIVAMQLEYPAASRKR